MENWGSINPFSFPMRHSFQLRNLRYVISASFGSIKSKENTRLNEELTFRQEAQRLPPELIIHIVSLFNDDRQTLKKCCLVSSAWLDLCRSQLYNDFTITITRVKDFLATVNDLERFEGVAKHIKDLIVYCDYHWGNPHQKPTICSHLFRGLLEKLPNLRSLTIRNARFSHSASHQTWKNFKSFLRSSSLLASNVQTSSDLCAFKHFGGEPSHPPKRPFPVQLEHLDISDIGADEDYASSFKEVISLFSGYTSFTCTPTHRSSIRFSQEYPSRVELTDEQELLWNFYHRFSFSTLHFNSSPVLYSAITFLWIGCASLQQFQEAIVLLREVNADLECFGIDPTGMYEDARVGVEPVDWSQLDLLRFASLKKLMLNMRYALLRIYQPESILDGRGRLLCRYPAELISTISRTVQDINILICLSDEEVETFMNFVDWDTLQNEFLKLQDLKHIRFFRTPCNLHRSRSTSVMDISDIQYKLPRLCSVLEIVDLKDFEGFEDEDNDS